MKALPALRVSDTQGDLRKCQGGGCGNLELMQSQTRGLAGVLAQAELQAPAGPTYPKKDSENFEEDIPNGTP